MATKLPPTKSEILAWAAKSTRPNGDCQGFCGNDFTSHFGTFKLGYYSANKAMEASKSLGHFHKGKPPSDGRVYWVFFQFPTYGHVMLFIDGIMIGDSSHCSHFLNKKRTIGTMKLEDYPRAYKYLGYSSSNGVNTVPAPAKIQTNLSTSQVKMVASFLNSKKLGKTSTASVTGINVIPGKTTSNYYWMLQKYTKEKSVTGAPTSTTYANEKKLYASLTATTPVPPPPVTTPPVTPVPPAPVTVEFTEAEVAALKVSAESITNILNRYKK